MSRLKNKAVYFLIVLIVILFLGYYCCSNLNFGYVLQQKDILLDFVNKNYTLSIMLAILVQTLIVISTLPIAGLFATTCGLLFGLYVGCTVAVIGGTIGAMCSFFIFKYFLGDSIQQKYSKNLAKFNREIAKYGARYLLILHFLVVIPFFLINTLSALANIPTWTFFWTTFIGIIPSMVLYTYAGVALNHVSKFSDLFSWQIILAFSLIIGMILISVLKDKIFKK